MSLLYSFTNRQRCRMLAAVDTQYHSNICIVWSSLVSLMTNWGTYDLFFKNKSYLRPICCSTLLSSSGSQLNKRGLYQESDNHFLLAWPYIIIHNTCRYFYLVVFYFYYFPGRGSNKLGLRCAKLRLN
jgi:hypothetical protein